MTSELLPFVDERCPVPAPIYWRGFTYATNGHVLVRVPAKLADDGDNHFLRISLHLWDHERLLGWANEPPAPTAERWFDEVITRPVLAMRAVQFCDVGGSEPMRFRWQNGQGLVWPVIKRSAVEC